MSKTKRKLSVGFKRFLAIVLVFVINTCSYLYFINKYGDTEEQIQEAYQEELRKYEIVETVAKNTVQNGTPITLQQNSNTEVLYEVSNDGNNIYARFWIDEERGDIYPYSVEFKLSQDFEILESEYPDREDYELFKKRYQANEHFLAIANSLILFMALYIFACLIYGVFGLTRWIIRLFKNEKKTSKELDTKPENNQNNNS